MEVPITQLRKDIFALANRVLEGETLIVAYKGRRLRMMPEISEVDPKTRFDRVTRLNLLTPELLSAEGVDMLPEMQKQWEKDWEEQGLL